MAESWTETAIENTREALATGDFWVNPHGEVCFKNIKSRFGYILVEDLTNHKYMLKIRNGDQIEHFGSLEDLIAGGWVLD